jgi:hypothetical protein
MPERRRILIERFEKKVVRMGYDLRHKLSRHRNGHQLQSGFGVHPAADAIAQEHCPSGRKDCFLVILELPNRTPAAIERNCEIVACVAGNMPRRSHSLVHHAREFAGQQASILGGFEARRKRAIFKTGLIERAVKVADMLHPAGETRMIVEFGRQLIGRENDFAHSSFAPLRANTFSNFLKYAIDITRKHNGLMEKVENRPACPLASSRQVRMDASQFTSIARCSWLRVSLQQQSAEL